MLFGEIAGRVFLYKKKSSQQIGKGFMNWIIGIFLIWSYTVMKPMTVIHHLGVVTFLFSKSNLSGL